MANLFDVYNDGLLIDHTEGETLETGETPITISGLTADTTYDKVQVGYAGSYNKSDVPTFKTNLARNYILNSDVSTSTSVTGFYTSVPSSYFNNKKLTVSVQVDYDNVTTLSNSKRIGAEFLILNKDGSNRYINTWKYPAIGDSFHGRIYTTFDFSNNEFQDYPTNQMKQGIYAQGVTGTNVSVSKPMLQIGSHVDDWRPAPEDSAT